MALIAVVVILSLELVYRLVALPLDYRPDRHEAALPEPRHVTQGELASSSTPEIPVASLSISRQLEQPPRRAAEVIETGPTRHASIDPAAVAPASAGELPALRLSRLIDRSPERALGSFDGEPPSVDHSLAGTAPEDAVPQAAAPSVQVGSAAPAPAEAAPVLVALPSVPHAVPRAGARPMIAVVIDDMGYSPASLGRLAAMPGPLTLAFLPAADATPRMLEAARARDFELMVHLPMEPIGDANPGPEALLVGLDEAEMRRRVRWALAQVPGAVGVNNHMGSRFTAQAPGLEIVMDELRESHLFFIDSRTNPASMAERVARRFGIPSTGRDIFIDHDPSPGAIARQLASIERFAARNGAVIAIGHPYTTTLAALEAWLPTLPERGFRLVRASEVLAVRLCADLTANRDGCRPSLHLVGTQEDTFRLPSAEAAP